LADLEGYLSLAVGDFEIEGKRICLANAAGPSVNLPSREEGQKGGQHFGRELCLSAHEVVLVAAKRRAGMMINVVLQKGDLVRYPEFDNCLMQEEIPRQVV